MRNYSIFRWVSAFLFALGILSGYFFNACKAIYVGTTRLPVSIEGPLIFLGNNAPFVFVGGLITMIIARALYKKFNNESTKRCITEAVILVTLLLLFVGLVVGSLNTARDKSRQSSIKATMSSMRAYAELYYDDYNSYGPSTVSCYDDGTLFTYSDMPDLISAALDTQRGWMSLCILGGDDVDAQALYMLDNNIDNIVECAALRPSLRDDEGGAFAISTFIDPSVPFWCVDSTGFAGETNSHIDSQKAKCIKD